jgi:glycosyltransferase involved in cell wall biosynthesis
VVELDRGVLFSQDIIETRTDLGAPAPNAQFYNTAMATFRPAPPERELTFEALDNDTVVASLPIAAIRTINGFTDIANLNAEMEPDRRLAVILQVVSEFFSKNADWRQISTKTRSMQIEFARSPTALRNIIYFAADDEAGKLNVAKALLRDKPLDLGEPAGQYLAYLTGEALNLSSTAAMPEKASLDADHQYHAFRSALDQPEVLKKVWQDTSLASLLLEGFADLQKGTPRMMKIAARLIGSEILSTAVSYGAQSGTDLETALIATTMHSARAQSYLEVPEVFSEALSQSETLRRHVAARPDIAALVLKSIIPAYKRPAPQLAPEKTVTTPTFSVVLAVYNGAKFLAAAIDSVLAQTFGDFEFIIIDDRSTDESAAIAATYAKADKRVRFVPRAINGGQSAAFNDAIALCRANHVAFIDADDLWFPEKLAKMKAYIDSGDTFSFLQHNMLLMFEDVPSTRSFRPTLSAGDCIAAMLESNAPLPGPFTPTSGTVFPLAILRSIGAIPPELRVCSDGFLTRAAAALGPVAALATPLGYYRLHGDNATVGNDDYDGNSYVSRVLLPILADYYAKTNQDIKLPGFRETRGFLRSAVIPTAHLQSPTEVDIDYDRIWTFVATGFGALADFSPAFVRMLAGVRMAVNEGDYGNLNKSVLANRIFNPREQALYLLLDCQIRLISSDNRGAIAKLERFSALLKTTITAKTLANRLYQRIGQKQESRDLMLGRLEDGLLVEDDTDSVADTFSRQEAGCGPIQFLQVQSAIIEQERYNTEYFTNDEWVQEKIEVVGGYERRNYKTGNSYRGFSVRENSLAGDEALQMILPGADLSEAKLLDLPGPTIFAGEWLIRTLDGFCVSDLYIGTPHHRGSSYGSVSQARTEYILVYPKVPTVSLEAAYLAGGDRNYYHWVMDVLPRLFFHKHAESTNGLRVVTGTIDRSFQRGVLAAVGIAPEDITEVSYPSTLRADRLVVPLLGQPNRTSSPAYSKLMRTLHDVVAGRTLPSYSVEPWTGGGDRIFVVRGHANHRRIVNEAEIVESLADAGWTIIDPAKLSFDEQIAAFNRASVVVGAHGAGLANLAFCRPKTKVMELAFPRWSPSYFEAICIGREIYHRRVQMREIQSLQHLSKFNHGFASEALIAHVRQFGEA